MTRPILRLCEDTLSNDVSFPLSAAARMIFVVHGEVRIGGQSLSDGETWHSEQGGELVSGKSGATVWRWELTDDSSQPHDPRGAVSREKLAVPLDTLPDGELLLRGDSVAFPPGGCAFMHTHQGPGIRCLLEGGIRIDTHGRSTSYGPGGAWFESGPEPVFAQAAADRPSRFIRVMVLPQKLLGASSIRYVDEADKDKPKSQKYQIFVDAPIGFRAS